MTLLAAESTAKPARRRPGQHGKRHFLDAEHKRGLYSYKDLDLRTAAGKRMAQLYRDLCVDLGGEDNMSTAERQLARRAAFLTALCEDDEVRWLKNLPFKRDEYLAALSCERRQYERLGLQRRQKDVTPPSLEQYTQMRTLEAAE